MSIKYKLHWNLQSTQKRRNHGRQRNKRSMFWDLLGEASDAFTGKYPTNAPNQSEIKFSSEKNNSSHTIPSSVPWNRCVVKMSLIIMELCFSVSTSSQFEPSVSEPPDPKARETWTTSWVFLEYIRQVKFTPYKFPELCPSKALVSSSQ